eukprot:TRINITY_DN123162_c0_g1_i1.p1 TRINITY_DN123162_c0_g1~~TRINITY_DN123162_c0_g1_i1.p1  ORF type:complete len:352 (+),score=87.12 TRINITY_DN123162_c0_g1_i1:67-1122(+)
MKSIVVRPRPATQEDMGLVKPSYASAYLTDEMARAVRLFCVDELQDATNRILLKIERRFAPLSHLVSEMERQLRRINVARLGELHATIGNVQVQMRELQSLLEPQHKQRALHQTPPDALKEELRKQAVASRDLFSSACVDIQVHLLEMRKACEVQTHTEAPPGSAAVVNSIQLQIEKMEQYVHEQGASIRELRTDLDESMQRVTTSMQGSNERFADAQAEVKASVQDLVNSLQECRETEAADVAKLEARFTEAKDQDMVYHALTKTEGKISGLQGDVDRVHTEMEALKKELLGNKAEVDRVETMVTMVEKELQLPEHRTPSVWLTKMRLKRQKPPPGAGVGISPVVPAAGT